MAKNEVPCAPRAMTLFGAESIGNWRGHGVNARLSFSAGVDTLLQNHGRESYPHPSDGTRQNRIVRFAAQKGRRTAWLLAPSAAV